ncbi:MAG: Galactose/methyl galactoside import ATP-binding protein MglA [Candidatus Heimdallarchaeota archaeon LC_2]|nr:MAG: Galactose/methyl galactoside import ATP-binding protein MglA [Candidatus Heimdallarchaeota archaeon LC_2]
MDTYLELIDICKSYYTDDGVVIKANDHVNFILKKGEVHALLGENGAGKSTLVRNLSRRPDSGKVLLDGKEVVINSPLDSMRLGIGISHQNLSKSLVDRHTVAENILSIAEGKLFSIKQISDKIKATTNKYNLDDIDPTMKIWKLSGGEKQRVEILKAIITNPDILILDEPTSMLTPTETAKLFALTTSLRDQGKSVIVISHHLEEAIEYCDRITVMRGGQVIETLDEKQVDKFRDDYELGLQTLANLMVGKEVLYKLNKGESREEKHETLLSVDSLSVNNDMGDIVVRNFDLTLKSNQILGLAGIAGNGQRELIEAILNLREKENGNVFIRDKPSEKLSIREIRDMGISYIPEIRNKGMISDLSIRHNLILNSYHEGSGTFIDNTSLVDKTNKLIEQYDIRTPNILASMSSLSGGNKQKVIVARELSKHYSQGNKIIIAENPTIGLDVGTTQFVRQQLLNKKNEGAGVLLVSGELTEILSLCDEIAVIYKGKSIGVVSISEATREMIGLMMGGVELSDIKGLGVK